MAHKYYWKAENRYQAEMKAYNENKTRKQYAELLKAFKIVTNDFKQSLEYYTKLYNLYPKPEYAKYLGNIIMINNEKCIFATHFASFIFDKYFRIVFHLQDLSRIFGIWK